MTQKAKQIVIIIVVIIVAFVGYKMFFVSSDSAGSATLASSQATSTPVADGQTILKLLGSLNQITLDTSVFSDQTFLSLQSFERPIQDQVSGRPNPFLPIGKDGATTILPTGTSTATSTPPRVNKAR